MSTTRPRFVRVADMFVNCSLRVRNFEAPGFAMSDCCGEHARTAVVMADGRQMWRCREHEGIRHLEMGPIKNYVEAYQ